MVWNERTCHLPFLSPSSSQDSTSQCRGPSVKEEQSSTQECSRSGLLIDGEAERVPLCKRHWWTFPYNQGTNRQGPGPLGHKEGVTWCLGESLMLKNLIVVSGETVRQPNSQNSSVASSGYYLYVTCLFWRKMDIRKW